MLTCGVVLIWGLSSSCYELVHCVCGVLDRRKSPKLRDASVRWGAGKEHRESMSIALNIWEGLHWAWRASDGGCGEWVSTAVKYREVIRRA